MGIHEKMLNVMAAVNKIPKKGTNAHQKYTFARAEDVFDVIRKAFVENRLVLYTTSETLFAEPGNAIVRMTGKIVDVDTGESGIIQGLGSGTDNGDKYIPKANTFAAKYMIANTFLVSWGDDPESDTKTDRNSADYTSLSDLIQSAKSKADLDKARDSFRKLSKNFTPRQVNTLTALFASTAKSLNII